MSASRSHLPGGTYSNVRFDDLKRITDRFHEEHAKAKCLRAVIVDELSTITGCIGGIEYRYLAIIGQIVAHVVECILRAETEENSRSTSFELKETALTCARPLLEHCRDRRSPCPQKPSQHLADTRPR
jgi:hypothetical protein